MFRFLLKPLLVMAIAVPTTSMLNIDEADAHHRKYRGAVIAGAIIGSVIAYQHYKKKNKHRYYKRYAKPHYRTDVHRHFHHHHHYYWHSHRH